MPAHKSSIFDLLNKDNLAIPDYQRPHKWTKRNIEELLTDISKAIEEGQKYGEYYTFTINKETEHRNLIVQTANVVVRGSSFCIFGSVPIISICNGGPISIDGEWCPRNYRTLKDIVPFCQTDLYRLPGLRLFHIGVKLLLGSHGVAHRSRTAKDAA